MKNIYTYHHLPDGRWRSKKKITSIGVRPMRSTLSSVRILYEAYPAVPGYSIPPFGPLWVNKAPIGRQIGIAASLATKKVRPASEASKTSAWAIVAVTWDSGISLRRPPLPSGDLRAPRAQLRRHASFAHPTAA